MVCYRELYAPISLPSFGPLERAGRAHRHRQDAAPPAPPPPPTAQATDSVGRERHETPDAARLNARDVRFHGGRERIGAGAVARTGASRGRERRGGGSVAGAGASRGRERRG